MMTNRIESFKEKFGEFTEKNPKIGSYIQALVRVKEKISTCLPSETTIETEVCKEYVELLPTVERLNKMVTCFDRFVIDNAELKALFEKYLQEYGDEVIACDKRSTDENIGDLHPSIERLLVLQLKWNDLRHTIRQRFIFLSRHPELETCFLEHLQRVSKDDWKEVQKFLSFEKSQPDNSLLQGTLKVEEI